MTHLLLLVLCKVRDEQSEALINPALAEEPLELLLNCNIKLLELGAKVQPAPLPVALGALRSGNRCIAVVCDAVTQERAILRECVNDQSTLAGGLGDGDAAADRVRVGLVLGHLAFLFLVRELVLIRLVDVRDGENELDAADESVLVE